MKNFFLLICTLFLSITTFSQQYDFVIKNGKLIDGTGNPWRIADLAIKDGKIQKIGTIPTSAAKKIIDAKGLIVCPGFIDVHTHVESPILKRGTADNFIYDGVTTLITGNCGSSVTDMAVFFKALKEQGTSVNVGSLIGHNAIRKQVMGNEDRIPSEKELIEMQNLVREAMREGAVGLSTGLIYLPGAFAKTEEIIALAKVAKEEGGIYVSHIRQEDHRVFDAIKEAAEIGIATKISVQISHFKITGKNNWGQTDSMIQLVETYRANGLDLTVDQYPYTASSTKLDVLLPEWVLEGTKEEITKRLQNKAIRQKVKKEMITMLQQMGFKNYAYAVIANCPWDQSLNGKSISAANILKGRKATVENERETIIDMVADPRRVSMVYHKMNEADIQNLMTLPYTMIASDAGIPEFGKKNPHPRAYGTNTRVLGRYVRELKILKLEDAIRKMTSFPAQKFNIKTRGLLKEGMRADVVVFDANKIADTATFEESHSYAKGIDYVFVNGVLILQQGEHLQVKAGQVVRRGE